MKFVGGRLKGNQLKGKGDSAKTEKMGRPATEQK